MGSRMILSAGSAREVVTVSRFYQEKPSGLTWQWRSKRLVEGFLYGKVDDSGRFTGPDILFLYPDMVTGILGTWREGSLVEGRAVDILAERCHHGLKELRTAPARHDSQVTWSLQVSLAHFATILIVWSRLTGERLLCPTILVRIPP